MLMMSEKYIGTAGAISYLLERTTASLFWLGWMKSLLGWLT
jgi:hypothetical protein